MDKIKFLMTDTGAQTTQLCRQALEAKGIDVTVCEKNGSQALKSLLEEHPQAVLLDAFMPDLDAITVKQRYETQDTRGGHTTFFVTGAFQSEEVEQDLEGLQVMRTVGKNMAWLLHCIEAGKAAGITTPEPEQRLRTNFIR